MHRDVRRRGFPRALMATASIATVVWCAWSLPPSEPTPGDVNGDHVVDAVDVQLVINAALGLDVGDAQCDINNDNAVDALDVQLVINAALGLDIGVVVPDLTGMAQADAESAIRDARLSVGTVAEAFSPTMPVGQVISQDPGAGTKVTPGTAVNLVVSKGPSFIYVDKATPASLGQQDGLSWQRAFADLQPGIDAAYTAGGGEVWVAAGVYNETRESYPHGHEGDWAWDTASVVIRPHVDIYGGFAGTESERDARDWSANETVIDGSTALLGAGPARHVVIGADDAALDGFTITGGEARGGDGNQDEIRRGGGMYNNDVSLRVSNSVFEANSAAYCGGGMYNRDAFSEISNCRFLENSADGMGGGIYDYNTSSQMTDCVFERNSGGAIVSMGGSPQSDVLVALTNCTFQENVGRAFVSGPYIATDITDCVFKFNYEGGAIQSYGPLLVTGCVFRRNHAVLGGAIDIRANAQLTNCIFHDNSAIGTSLSRGGAVYAVAASPLLTNCTFYCTKSTNLAGGALRSEGGAEVFLRNSIVWGPEADISTEEGSHTFVVYSNVQGAYAGSGNIDFDPLFVDSDSGDFQLQPASPCIDSGTTEDAPGADIRGVTRPQGAGVDMGAYEMLGGEE
jgi:hypothetical protein